MKKWFGGWVVAVLVLAFLVPTASAAPVYTDVPESGEHSANILLARELGVMTGYPDGTFKPGKAVYRADAIKALGKLVLSQSGETLDSYNVEGVKAFADVPADGPDEELYRLSLVVRNAGIFDGNPNNNVSPRQLISREQMAKVLVNAFGLKDVPDEIVSMRDLHAAAPYFREPILVLAKNNVTHVLEFRPKEAVSRGQFASFLVRAHDTRAVKYAVEEVEQPAAVRTAAGVMPNLPVKLEIRLVNGITADAPVFWNLKTADLLAPGDYTVEGTVGDTGRTAEIVVTVE
ncbi:S-layer homology domain-containing protein [Bhargavaea ullalensis]|uniref:SLH domain-containing protein n=1 Tax=Bhargavaea ullalensis TaxID=1265685 RepID=A0ABV2GD12_9BACL